MQTISRATMDEVIDANKYLQLPRLSSQLFFNQLCPQSSDAHTRRQVLIQCFTAGILVCIICGRNSETDCTTVEWQQYLGISTEIVSLIFQNSIQNLAKCLHAVDILILYCPLLVTAMTALFGLVLVT